MLEDIFCFRRFILPGSVVLSALWNPAFTTNSYAGAVTWGGGTGKWSDANWTPARPGAADDVTLSIDNKSGTITLDINDTIDKLTVKPKNTLLLNNGTARTLTITTSVTNNTKTIEGTKISGGNSMVVGDLKKKTGDLNNNGNFGVSGGTLTVGGNLKDSGALGAASSSTVTVGGNLGSSGTLGVNRSTVTVGGKLTNEIGDTVGKIGITNGSNVTAGELAINGNPFKPEDNLTLRGSTLMVTGDTSNKGQIQVGDINGNARLTVGGKFTNEGMLTVGNLLGSNAANKLTAGKGFENSSVVIVNPAGMSAAGGELSVATGDYKQTDGTTTVMGTLMVTAGKYLQDKGDTIVGSPTVKGQLTAKGNVEVNDGKLQGSGNVKSPIVKNGGEVIPGFKEPTAGTLTITGDYQQETAGTLNTLFQGTTPGDWSVLDISGKAALAGTLDVSLINGFAFNESEIGDVFGIMDFAPGKLTGAFSLLELNDVITPGSTSTMLNLGGNLDLLVGYNDNDVTLTLEGSIAPAPAPRLGGWFTGLIFILFAAKQHLDSRRARP
jgi:filamentous hemagglutinin